MMIPLSAALKLGRVSNLPTVWTNVMAGIALAGGVIFGWQTLVVILAISLFYIGGMFLNDACDAEIDAVERPERPIPSGVVDRKTVFTWAYGMMGASVLILLAIGIWPALGGAALTGMIIAYNMHHKNNPLSPLIMGLCRVLVYITAALTVAAAIGAPVWIGAALLLAHLIGLTYTAKQENLGEVKNLWPLGFLGASLIAGLYMSTQMTVVLPFLGLLAGAIGLALHKIMRRAPGDIPKAVVGLIAAIALLDAMLIASTGAIFAAMLAVGAYVLTLALQRYVAGT